LNSPSSASAFGYPSSPAQPKLGPQPQGAVSLQRGQSGQPRVTAAEARAAAALEPVPRNVPSLAGRPVVGAGPSTGAGAASAVSLPSPRLAFKPAGRGALPSTAARPRPTSAARSPNAAAAESAIASPVGAGAPVTSSGAESQTRSVMRGPRDLREPPVEQHKAMPEAPVEKQRPGGWSARQRPVAGPMEPVRAGSSYWNPHRPDLSMGRGQVPPAPAVGGRTARMVRAP